MPSFTVNGRTLQADLFVLDKDGLMFDSGQFWIELADARCRELLSVCSEEQTLRWARIMGADTRLDERREPHTTHVDPLGILAVAPPHEEVSITAAYLISVRGWPWHEARRRAVSLFERSDQTIDLKRALKPQPGFVEFMRRLIALDVPYGVATSDTYERTRDSMSIYNCWDRVRFVVTPEDVPAGKPEPDMLIHISRTTGVPLDRIAMVGDSYVDVKMAANAGCIGIGVTADPEMRDRMRPIAAAVVDSLHGIQF